MSISRTKRVMEVLMMKRVAAKFVIWRDLHEELKDDPQFLTKFVIGDVSWCYGYNPESEQQSSQWKWPDSPRAKIARQVPSSFKTVHLFFLCWWDSAQGVCFSRTHSKSEVLLECVEKIAREPATKSSRKVAEWGLVLAPWQRPRPHSPERPAVLG